MSDLVAPDQIEGIVGSRRRVVEHLGRAVSSEEVFYILHSQQCLDSGIDLRDCPFSVALDSGIDPDEFTPDAALLLGVDAEGYLYQERSLIHDGEATP